MEEISTEHLLLVIPHDLTRWSERAIIDLLVAVFVVYPKAVCTVRGAEGEMKVNIHCHSIGDAVRDMSYAENIVHVDGNNL